MDKLDMFQARFVKANVFGLCDLEQIKTGAGTKFTSTEFQEVLSVCCVQLTLSAKEHKVNNCQIQGAWRTLLTIAH